MQQIKVAREREEAHNAQVKIEHGYMMRERACMAANDKEDLFKRHFNNVMDELAKQVLAAEKLKAKREGEDAFLRKARAEVFHIIERCAHHLRLHCIYLCGGMSLFAFLTLSCSRSCSFFLFPCRMKLDGLLERSEREKMFREEYTQRRIDNHFKHEKIRWHDADLYLMGQEDHLASCLRAEEQKESAFQEDLLRQMKKVKALLKEEEHKERLELLEKRAKGEAFDEYKLLKLDIDPTTEYLEHVKIKQETLQEVVVLVKDSFRRQQRPHEALCNCHHEWTSSLPLMKACAQRVDTAVREALDQSNSVSVATVAGTAHRFEQEGGETVSMKSYLKLKKRVKQVPCRVDFKWKPDKNCVHKYRSIRALQSYRLLRFQKLRVLLENGKHFKDLHQFLLKVRLRLRVEKFASRKERRPVIDQAISLEKQMDELEKSILEDCLEICENGRLEKMHFLNLFCVHIGSKVEKENIAKKNAKKKKLPGYMQQKKEVGPIVVSGANSHDLDRMRTEISVITGQLVEVLDEGGDSEADDDEYPCPSACTISPKGEEQIVVLDMAPPLPSYVQLHFHLKRTEAEQAKADELQKRAEMEAIKEASNANAKPIFQKQSLLKSAALNSPLSKFGHAESPQSSSPPMSPLSKKKSKISKRQSVSYNVSSKELDKSASKVKFKMPRISMQHENEDYDISRKKSLLQNVIDLEIDKVIPKEGSRVIPGLSKYPSEDTHLYLPLVRIEEIKSWSQSMSRWYDEVEMKWKKSKSPLCLTFLQRARFLLNGGERHKQLFVVDASLASVFHSASALDLVELLCCRSTLVMRVSFHFFPS
jgi:hypothetical protein